MEQQLEAFLSLIAWSEGTSTHPLTKDDGYDVLVSGVDGREIFTDYSIHPFESRPPTIVRRGDPPLTSTAAGRYQILHGIWYAYRTALGYTDFGHETQDHIARRLIEERGALSKISAGDIRGAITACSGTWASFPGNRYGQGGHSMDALLAQHAKIVGA